MDGGGSPPGQTESIGNSENYFEVGGGILSPQLILLRGSMIFSKKTNH